MSKATRLEPALASTEREPFDLTALMLNCVKTIASPTPAARSY